MTAIAPTAVWINAADPRVEAAGNGALGLLVNCALWSAEHEMNGHVPAGIAYSLGTEEEVDALEHYGLWNSNPGGFWIVPGVTEPEEPHR